MGACVVATASLTTTTAQAAIDRKALVSRNNPVVTSVDTLASLSVGNGGFAFTADVTGLQTFPEYYSNGVPLGTMSEWGWHSFPNSDELRREESYKSFDFGHGHRELYATEFKEQGRARAAASYFRSNPHRLHLGCMGLEMEGLTPGDIKKPRQTLDMWNGVIRSRFMARGSWYSVQTVCHPERDMVSSQIKGKEVKVNLRFPYPTGGHSDHACNWTADDKHTTELVSQTARSAVLKRTIDNTTYYVSLCWEEDAVLKEKARNYWVLEARGQQLTLSCLWSDKAPATLPSYQDVLAASNSYWQQFWLTGAAVDFSRCRDPRAKELERRVVLSQWLLAIQCAAGTPPQETGLTYNSWFGKFHMEMIWWHQAWLPLWGHPALLDRTLRWYETVEPIAREIAMRQGFKGVRWMKMTDRSGEEAPSKVGSFLIWQQPHLIYLAELLYRSALSSVDNQQALADNQQSSELLKRYGRLIDETATFMADFATYDQQHDRYILKGMIPAQETLKASETYNSPFELAYWHWALQTAQQWRERRGKSRVALWDDIIQKLSPLAKDAENRYLAAESNPETYSNVRLISDHPAVLGAVGIFPMSRLIDPAVMKHTQEWIWDNWNWDHTWGWDYPMVAMNATRLGDPDHAVSALLMDKRTNTYLVNGHNYQDQRLRCYLPGNGGLLTAIALMCAGWDGCTVPNPGFPKNGQWDVRWEGLQPLPGDPSVSQSSLSASKASQSASKSAAASAQQREKYEFMRNLPVYADSLIADLTYPLAWGHSDIRDFNEWRQAARQKVFDCMLTPPPAAQRSGEQQASALPPVKVLFEEQRNGYKARKIEIQLSRYYTVPAYVLIPDGKGPFPAVNALHDHGGHLFIGKEKMIRPLACEDAAVIQDADEWSAGYEGQFFGDYLAQHGYVVFSADAPMWGERGQKEGARRNMYDMIAGNMMMYGIDLSAYMTYDDLAGTEYLASLPEVDASRIGCTGWSMGGYRSWMLAALSDRIKVGTSVCWMVTTDEQMGFRYSRTENGGFANCFPGLRRWLDYPHIASIACPKPMLFINGSQDKLFPVPGVRKAFHIMHDTWDSQGADDKLETELWDIPHSCGKKAQERVLQFFEKHLK